MSSLESTLENMMADLMKEMDDFPAHVLRLADRQSIDYHETDFWQTIRMQRCHVLDGETVLRMFQDMCRLLATSVSASHKVLQLAGLLAMQLRSPKDHSALLVDYGACAGKFTDDISPQESEDRFLVGADDEFVPAEGVAAGLGDLLRSVERMRAEEALIVGPAFGCLIMLLEKCGSRTVAGKLCLLKDNLKTVYPWLRNNPLTVRVPGREELVAVLDKYRERRVGDCLKNTVLVGYMHAYHKQPAVAAANGMRELLDFLALECIRHASMQLLTLVDRVAKVYGCSVHQYKCLTQVWPAERSWVAYDQHAQRWGSAPDDAAAGVASAAAEQPQPQSPCFWRYAREFDHRVFQLLTYNHNRWLCNLSADLLDLKLNAGKMGPWPVLGPIYQGLTRFKRSKSHRPYLQTDHEFALQVHGALVAEART